MTTGQSGHDHSLAIRQEIQRFESVHPSIYAIYDLIDLVPDAHIAKQIREHVVAIEDSFVNSHEWTLARDVPELHLGIIGSSDSGKSALVHRYLTGSFMHEESPEGGRFKKEVFINDQSYLLLIRDEGGVPEAQFSAWIDALLLVFSLENEESFSVVCGFYNRMCSFRNMSEVPKILVGVQDSINDSNPRVIKDVKPRKLACDLRCPYYETCAIYGLNVERVFQDVCQKIIQQNTSTRHFPCDVSQHSTESDIKFPVPVITKTVHLHNKEVESTNSLKANTSEKDEDCRSIHNSSVPNDSGLLNDNFHNMQNQHGELRTSILTPTTIRKFRRKSNIFTPSKKEKYMGEMGVGREIPVKQGYLFKRSSKSLKEWKKKYVTLLEDGRLTYHSSLHDYMNDTNGKEILLQYVTVKVPGKTPKGSKSYSAQEDSFEFSIISLENKTWHFEANNAEDRDSWISAIEQQILSSLQNSDGDKKNETDAFKMHCIKNKVSGNDACVDCGASNPDWASLNLGVLMCIECSGIHRNLGSHISKVRSLDLDDWSAGHLSVMLALGNNIANSVWEYCLNGKQKPVSDSSREEKEQWIRWKYEDKLFLPPINPNVPLGKLLIDSVCRGNMRVFTFCLTRCSYEDINMPVNEPEDLRTPLHLACATGNLAMAQLLIWHKANPQNLDHEGRTCMSYVRALEKTLDNSSDSMEMQKLLEVLEQASVSGMDDADAS
ncbi:PREDICTED: centaurin-gamma-1A isoform X1 [Dinoponera quadriceps]|uniref:Centaurin-gamma-1A isoform X1 n=1 Tax=Dinoponera quadriceps TaxID=609295 RepID=A0A6P3WWZ7_DINQU|nr:PREDICTED: centaurin-gamma-1A isoform X1 [Dinoponera quadriceps]